MNAPVPEISKVWLHNKQTGESIEAELWHGIVEKHLADWEAEWKPEIERLLKLLNRQNVDRLHWPQSRGWNWRVKMNAIKHSLGNLSFALVAEGMTQAMMTVDLTRRSRRPGHEREHLVYVDFLEAAPWNRTEVPAEPAKFGRCGTILIGAAIQQSIQEGFDGRIGLHSLPQANRFYSNACGMADLGQDANYENLRYFEMDPGKARDFNEKGRT